MTFRKQLGFYLTRKFGSTDDKKSWADACGLEYNYFVVIMSGAKKPPSEDKIIEIAKSLDLSDAETETLLALSLKEKAKSPETKGILTRALEAMEKRIAATNDFTKQKTPDNVIALKAETHVIPIYTTIKAGNGEMGITDGESDGEISITEEYYKQKVFALRVSGDSMAPELYDGEIAIFKPINGDPTREKDIYAVEIEGWASWAVKFVRPDPSGNVLLISANPTYQVKEINPKVSHVALRGKLIESRRIRK